MLVDATRAALVVDELGEQAVVARHDDGAVEVVLPVVNREAFRTWVLELLEHAEVLGPPELRDDLVAWLRALAAGATSRRQGAGVSPRPLVGPRLQRVLAVVPWVLAHPGVTVAELAERFEVPEEELERDLALLPLCGLPPYTADRLIDVSVIDGEVEIRLAEYFARPLRLSPAEGLALLAAGRTLLSVPGADTAGPLATALDKLEQALGAKGRLSVDVGPPDRLDQLRDAVQAHERLEIDYYSFARDEMTTRVVDPWRVFHAFGAWYLAAWCHRAQR